MKKIIILLGLVVGTLTPKQSNAWRGYEGHTIVVKLAVQFVQPDVKQNLLTVLNGMSLDTAGNWMDIIRSNSDYDFMKPWHYEHYFQLVQLYRTSFVPDDCTTGHPQQQYGQQ